MSTRYEQCVVDAAILNNPEPQRPTLVVLAEAVDRWAQAQDDWNSLCWRFGSQDPVVDEALGKLVKASDELRKMVRR